MLTEVNQAEKESKTLYDFTYMLNLKKQNKRINIKQNYRQGEQTSELVIAGWWGGGGEERSKGD